MNSLINRTALRRYILDRCQSMRPHLKLTRVEADTMDRYEARLRAMIVNDVARHPSRGKTFVGGGR